MDEAFGDELEQAFTDWDAEQVNMALILRHAAAREWCWPFGVNHASFAP